MLGAMLNPTPNIPVCTHDRSQMKRVPVGPPAPHIVEAVPKDDFKASDHVDPNEVKDLFLELTQVRGKSLHERQIADTLKQKIEAMGYRVKEDRAGEAIGGNTGNLIVDVPGTVPDAPGLIFLSHMDTVPLAEGVKPQVGQDGIIRSDGTTALGGDDRSGNAEILTVMRILKEDNIPHPPLQFIFTVAEEKGLWGSRALNPRDVKGKLGFEADFFHPNEILWGTEWTDDGPVDGPPHPRTSQETFLEQFTFQAIRDVGMEPEKWELPGASSDSASLRQMDIPALIIGAGEQDVHTRREHIAVSDMAKSTELMLTLIHNANGFMVNAQDQIVPRPAAKAPERAPAPLAMV